MRINKYIAQSGVCSRRKADELISAGKVSVNGSPMTEPGFRVKDEDRVEVEGREIQPTKKMLYFALNKPVGYLTTASDKVERPTVMELMGDITERVFPVGRLDFDTSGLIIMTNDGQLSHKVAHPGHKVGKTYVAKVMGGLSAKKLNVLAKGVDIGGFITSPAEVQLIKQTKSGGTVQLTIYEGKNRQVRKMFAAVGCPVIELRRISIGKIHISRLKEGHYRKLTKDEVEYLRSM